MKLTKNVANDTWAIEGIDDEVLDFLHSMFYAGAEMSQFVNQLQDILAPKDPKLDVLSNLERAEGQEDEQVAASTRIMRELAIITDPARR